MHLLLFHEAVQIDSTSDTSSSANAGPPSLATRSTLSTDVHDDGADGDAVSTQGSHHRRSVRLTMAVEAVGGPGSGGAGSGRSGSSRGDRRLSAAATSMKSGRFSTTARVREFRAVLKGAAAHASKMKVHPLLSATYCRVSSRLSANDASARHACGSYSLHVSFVTHVHYWGHWDRRWPFVEWHVVMRVPLRRRKGGPCQPGAKLRGRDSGTRRRCRGFEQVHQPRQAEQAADQTRGQGKGGRRRHAQEMVRAIGGARQKHFHGQFCFFR